VPRPRRPGLADPDGAHGPAAVAALDDFTLEAAVLDANHPGFPEIAQLLRDAAGDRRLSIIAIGKAAIRRRASTWPCPSRRIRPRPRSDRTPDARRHRRRGIPPASGDLRPAGRDAERETPDPAPLKILVAGGADPRFIALSNALTAAGAEVVAAPTPYTAFDYLHEAAFDAAVLWGAPDHAPALSIAAGMKRNTRLYHIPLILYLRSAGEINLAELYNRGFADIAAADTPESETAERVLGLAASHRRHQAIRKALETARGSGLMDSSTGLFTRELFASHLARLAEGAKSRRRALSVCVLRVADSDSLAHARAGGWLDRAMPQIGAMVSRLVRVEDTAALLAPEVFALALPATPGPAGRLAAERIAAVVGCTAFDAGPIGRPSWSSSTSVRPRSRPARAPPPSWNAPPPTCRAASRGGQGIGGRS
jgi:two-component system cell cycle response regulator PopA